MVISNIFFCSFFVEEDWDDVDIPRGETLTLKNRIHTSSSSVKLEDLSLGEESDKPLKPKRLR
jgi:hypothetical protein